MTHPTPKHVAIVGAGAFGAAAALVLRARGWKVTVIDPGPLPHEGASSTDVSKVIRMDYGSDRFYLELGEAALEGWHRWNRDWPRALYHEEGFLILSKAPMRPGSFEANSLEALRDRGHTAVGLDDLPRTALAQWNLDSHSDGYFNPRAGWAESGAVVDRLIRLGEAEGVEFHFAQMDSLLSSGSRVTGVLTTSGDSITADRVLVAAGAWTPTLLPWLSDVMWSTAHPVLHFQVEDPAPFRPPSFSPWAADISRSGWYGFPSLADGRVKVANHGAGVRCHPDERGTVSDDQVARTRDFLRESIPGLAERPVVYRRVCMYCDTFDGDLFIGCDPAREGLVVATGGSGHGFKFAPVLGDVIADAVEEADNRWASRFRWRERGQLKTEEARFTGD